MVENYSLLSVVVLNHRQVVGWRLVIVMFVKVLVHKKSCQLVPSVSLVESAIEGCIFFTVRLE